MAAGHSSLWVPERAEIIFIQFNPHVGKEMPDEHPMLVVSTKEFSARTSVVMGFPMTHSDVHADNPFAIAVPETDGRVGYVLTQQPKSFDWRARGARSHPLGTGHVKLLKASLKRFDAIFGICDH